MEHPSIWDTVGISEVYGRDSRGKTILNFCADIFIVINNPNHPQHLEHRENTKHTLREILNFLSKSTVDLLSIQSEWEKDQSDKAVMILDAYIDKKVEELTRIVYRSTARSRRKANRRSFSIHDAKIACIFAQVFDFEAESEDFVEIEMCNEEHGYHK